MYNAYYYLEKYFVPRKYQHQSCNTLQPKISRVTEFIKRILWDQVYGQDFFSEMLLLPV